VLWVLEHRLDQPAPAGDAALAGLLDRIVRETRHRFPAVHDLATELRYRTFDEPFLAEVRGAALTDADRHLDALATDPAGPEREAHVAALVECPQPLTAHLSRRFADADAMGRGALLEVMTRRYYRIRHLGGLATGEVGGVGYATGDYDLDGRPHRVISAHLEETRLDEGVRALRSLVDDAPPGREVVVDLYLWRPGPGDPVETTRAGIGSVVGDLLGPTAVRRVVVALSSPESGPTIAGVLHLTYRRDDDGRLVADPEGLDVHPLMAERLQMWRLAAFDLTRIPTPPDVYLFHGRARENTRDERLFALAEVRDLTAVRDESGAVQRLPELERVLREVLGGIRRVQARRPPGRRLSWNRVLLYVWPPIDLTTAEMSALAERLAPDTAELGIEKVQLLAQVVEGGAMRPRVVDIANPTGDRVQVRIRDRADDPLRPLDRATHRVVSLRQRGLVHPFDLVRMLAGPEGEPTGVLPAGWFQEHDLDGDRLVPVDRPDGQNSANVVAGVVANTTAKHPEGMRRVILLGDPGRGMGALAEPECRRIMAALDLAEELGVPVEWFAVSAGALISMDSGTENMDWIARVLRRIIEFTQAGGELNVVVAGINVGAQPYWNAEATMLMHTKGILVMIPESAMVLTGKDALDFSGGVSAEDNLGVGGYERIMGPNGQAQYLARDLHDACRILLRHYDHAYVAPGERFPRPASTTDPRDRDVRPSPHGGEFPTVGDVFSDAMNPDRKRPFEIRRVMAATVDQDQPTLERWYGMESAELAVVWDAHLGGYPVCLLGMESKNRPRPGFVPADGPAVWTAGTLFPMGSKKVARAINAASGSRPLVVLANLSGFDGSPESLRQWQLEYGAEIGRAVVNFRGPIVFCVVSRYHGGAFVVFSGTLHDNMEVVALEGSRASVIGGAPAAAVVFAREVARRTEADPELAELEQRAAAAEGAERAELRSRLVTVRAEAHSRALGAVAAEFDAVHDVERARKVGSLDRIISVAELRPYLIDALERGMARELERG
jgi:acetyl-CoA carboxylase carboxyltransferase component